MVCLCQKDEDAISVLLAHLASGTDWFIDGCAMSYHVYVIMHIQEP